MTKLEAFETHGTWTADGLAWLNGTRAPEFDIIDESGQTAETLTCDICGQFCRVCQCSGV